MTIIAGGTDLLVRARRNGGLGRTIDVSRVDGLSKIVESDGKIRIGAAATHAMIAGDGLIRERAASLAQALGQVGSPQIRNMGTIGGNLINASPAADSLPPLLIHDGAVTLESSRGLREMSIEAFITGPYRTAIRPGELHTSVLIDPLAGYREGYRRVTKRAALAVSRLSVAWAIKEKDGYFQDLRLSIGSCTPIPFRAREAEEFLKGREKSAETIARAVGIISNGIVGASGMRPSYVYKLPVLRDLVTEILKG
jgi:CO/xanthine dehydrogenase FAD-binding subunit